MRSVPYKVVKRYVRFCWTRYGAWMAPKFMLGGRELFELHSVYGLHPDFVEYTVKRDMRAILSMTPRSDNRTVRFV